MSEDITKYSEEFPGVEGNYKWPVRFDITSQSKFLRIVQKHEDGTFEIVLLCPSQVKAMLAFLESPKK